MYMISVGFSAILVPDMCRICVGYVPDSINFDQCFVLENDMRNMHCRSQHCKGVGEYAYTYFFYSTCL